MSIFWHDVSLPRPMTGREIADLIEAACEINMSKALRRTAYARGVESYTIGQHGTQIFQRFRVCTGEFKDQFYERETYEVLRVFEDRETERHYADKHNTDEVISAGKVFIEAIMSALEQRP